uniref:Uncharacterized protein n=1 Tax=Salix viminalis TaxID=40686 RepID=A0A6N2K4H9_SALVM
MLGVQISSSTPRVSLLESAGPSWIMEWQLSAMEQLLMEPSTGLLKILGDLNGERKVTSGCREASLKNKESVVLQWMLHILSKTPQLILQEPDIPPRMNSRLHKQYHWFQFRINFFKDSQKTNKEVERE